MLSLLFQLSYITQKKHCKLLPAMPFVTLYLVWQKRSILKNNLLRSLKRSQDA